MCGSQQAGGGRSPSQDPFSLPADLQNRYSRRRRRRLDKDITLAATTHAECFKSSFHYITEALQYLSFTQ